MPVCTSKMCKQATEQIAWMNFFSTRALYIQHTQKKTRAIKKPSLPENCSWFHWLHLSEVMLWLFWESYPNLKKLAFLFAHTVTICLQVIKKLSWPPRNGGSYEYRYLIATGQLPTVSCFYLYTAYTYCMYPLPPTQIIRKCCR
jgi:hypothetical protein